MLNYDIDFTIDIPDSTHIELDGQTHKDLPLIGLLSTIMGQNRLKMGDLGLLGVDLKACGSSNCLPRKIINAGAT